jgi:hypothetical protein
LGTIVDFVYVHVNEDAAHIAGQTVAGMVGHKLLELHPFLKDTGLHAALRHTLATGEELLLEDVVIPGREGTPLNASSTTEASASTTR